MVGTTDFYVSKQKNEKKTKIMKWSSPIKLTLIKTGKRINTPIISLVAVTIIFLFLVFVTLNKEEGSKEYRELNIERKLVYTKRLRKIKKVCRKYGLLDSQEGKVPVTKSKIIQLSHNPVPPFYDKV